MFVDACSIFTLLSASIFVLSPARLAVSSDWSLSKLFPDSRCESSLSFCAGICFDSPLKCALNVAADKKLTPNLSTFLDLVLPRFGDGDALGNI